MNRLELLNEAQYQAVTHGEGALLLLAGPGSGKTYVITQRIFYLIEEKHIPPEEILVITFTKEAALSMHQRFRETMRGLPSASGQMPVSSYPVHFGTFHSIFYHILRKSAPSCTRILLRERQKKELIQSAISNTKTITPGNNGLISNSQTASLYLSAISYYKNTGDIKKASGLLPKEEIPFFSQVLKKYEAERRQIGALDFDDMVYECVWLLERDKVVRDYWSGRFSHILIDEFQDINPMQYRMVKLLASPSCHFFAVGDDDQSIYGFRGSCPACMRLFEQEFHAKRLVLNMNYRSFPEIVKASGMVIGENKDRFSKELLASPQNITAQEKERGRNSRGTADASVKICSFGERREQWTYLAKQLREKGEETCAVLFRTNVYLRSFAAVLEREGISFHTVEKVGNVRDHFVFRDMMSYLRLVSGERERELFYEIINKPLRQIGREELNRWLLGEASGKLSLMERQLKCAGTFSPFLAVQYIRRVIGYEKWLQQRANRTHDGERQWEEWCEVLDFIGEEAREWENLKDWMEKEKHSEDLIEEGDRLAGIDKKQSTDPSVYLMTVHASKGLEFDRVYLPDCNEKIFPHGSLPDQESCEEERRIFYVAMTRAKKSLELCYLTGTKERPRLISRFLNPLLKIYSSSDSTTSSNSHSSRYSSKASTTSSYSSSSSI